jgi:hypothetical protein
MFENKTLRRIFGPNSRLNELHGEGLHDLYPSSDVGVSKSVRNRNGYSRWFFARKFVYPEDGGDMFLRNVGSHKIYTVPHLRRRHS